MLAQVLLLVFFIILVPVIVCAVFEAHNGNDRAGDIVILAVMMIFSFVVGIMITDWFWVCFVVDNNIFEWAIDDKGWSFIRMVK